MCGEILQEWHKNLRGARNMTEEMKRQVLFKLMDRDHRVKAVVDTVGVGKFLDACNDITKHFYLYMRGEETLENIASKYADFCWEVWQERYPELYADGIDPCQQELGYVFIDFACNLFKDALNDALNEYPGD